MILPTSDFDPMFADDGVLFRDKMLNYIEQEFADILGDRRRLLRSESGLDWLARQLHRELAESHDDVAA